MNAEWKPSTNIFAAGMILLSNIPRSCHSCQMNWFRLILSQDVVCEKSPPVGRCSTDAWWGSLDPAVMMCLTLCIRLSQKNYTTEKRFGAETVIQYKANIGLKSLMCWVKWNLCSVEVSLTQARVVFNSVVWGFVWDKTHFQNIVKSLGWRFICINFSFQMVQISHLLIIKPVDTQPSFLEYMETFL